ncbi:MAG: glucose-6-phosphate isomerase [Gammaproteobacteria bacterium]
MYPTADPDPTALPEWKALERHAQSMRGVHMRDLFSADAGRAARMSTDVGALFADWSKHRVTDETLAHLHALANAAQLPAAIHALFSGTKVNTTEDRAAMHWALRAAPQDGAATASSETGQAVRAVHAQMRAWLQALSTGDLRGATGAPFTDVVSIGIGGSYLGPMLAAQACGGQGTGVRVHFVANLDAHDLIPRLERLDPAATLFIIASKSFTTLETFTNAETARRWLAAGLPAGADVGRHFVAITANTRAATAFGIDPANVFAFWDWVGGRYSLWSAIGLPAAIALGMDGFLELLAGARAKDEHFRTAPLARNLPATLGLIGLWYANFLGAQSQAVVVYDERLRALPEYLQQLDMESNGKRVTHGGRTVAADTAPILWGGVGTNAQHAFFQLLHQGTRLVPVDFIAAIDPGLDVPPHHDLLLANCFAQARALMWGRTEAEARAELAAQNQPAEAVARLAPHKVFPGNAPSTTILLPRLSPASLGALIALYEHRTYVQGAIWGINSFDQWGVELGKQMALAIQRDLDGAGAGAHYDASTAALIARYRAGRRPG